MPGSIVTVQVGQAGNQLGQHLFNLYAKHAVTEGNAATEEKFFSRKEKTAKLRARAVLVDMEAKVINAAIRDASRSKEWCYNEKRQFHRKSGAGNNWAAGYCSIGEGAIESVLDLVSKEVEMCDRFEGFMIPMSVAGGTGSGFGTRLTEALRDGYQNSVITNQIIWPYSSGEVIVQNYNAILSLAHLHQCSDALFFIQNDSVHDLCSRMLGMKSISLELMNKEIARNIAGIMLPAYVGADFSRPLSYGDLVGSVCSNPDYKLVTPTHVPQMPDTHKQFTSYNWSRLIKIIHQMAIANSPCEEGINWRIALPAGNRTKKSFTKSVAQLLILRGLDTASADVSVFHDNRMYSSWNREPFSSYACPTQFCGHEKGVALLNNSESVIHPLETTISKAWSMFTSRAFVHQFSQFGVTEDSFMDNFAKTEQILKSYKEI
eukprot:m.89262 g.89262  ORF g.89262 m.89262 type:complete len:433 (+) comp13210_c0_seq3:98-1396(+)